MTSTNILVTGATGKTGASVVDMLRRRGFAVRAMVHQLDERSRQLEWGGHRSIGSHAADCTGAPDIRKDNRGYS